MAPNAPSVQDVVVEGKVDWADGSTGTITIKAKGRDRLRHEVALPNGFITYAIGEGKGFSLRDGKRQQLPLWVTAYQRLEFIPFLSRLADYNRSDTKVTYLGTEEVDGRRAHHIRLSALPKEGSPAEIEELISEFHAFVDTQSLLVVKTQGFLFSPEAIENRSPVETYFSDFRVVNGLLIPHRFVRFISGQKDAEITLTSVRFNLGLSDSEFE